MRRFIFLKMMSLLVMIFLTATVAESSNDAANVFDIHGRFLGCIDWPHPLIKGQAVALPAGTVLVKNGGCRGMTAGIYFLAPAQTADNPGHMILDEFSFIDVTEEYLPLEEWDASAVENGDLNNDGFGDIVFARDPFYYDAEDDYRLRIWMQTPEGDFIDESEARIPPVSTPCYNIKLFDIDSDGDLDIFTSGYSGYYHIPAALFINDGTGHFTDESETRLPQLTGISYVYFSDFADFDNNGSLDLIVTVFNYPEAPDYEIITAVLWMNYSSGYFIADTLGRLPANTGYGFFMPLGTDINNDGNIDLIFANMEYTVYDEVGNPLAEFSGQNACYRNTGAGFFVDETDARMPQPDCVNTRDIAASDVDGDGDIDISEIGLFFYQCNEQNRILLNDGSGTYSVLPGAFPEGLEGWFNDSRFGLLNDDDFPDLFMVKVMPGMPDYDVLLVNGRDGSFSDSSSLLPEVLDFSTSSALFDHDFDDDIDIFVANSSSGYSDDTVGQNVLYHNLLNDLTGIAGSDNTIPESFGFSRCHPNPFNASTAISYSLPEQDEVTISIHNILGQKVATIFEGMQESGEYTITWDASDFPSGVYFARMEAAAHSENIKMVLLK
jgi:hypothetical protein